MKDIKCHDSWIFDLIQLKDGNLLTACIDGTFKLIDVGNLTYTLKFRFPKFVLLPEHYLQMPYLQMPGYVAPQ